jgi:hypothetical protein
MTAVGHVASNFVVGGFDVATIGDRHDRPPVSTPAAASSATSRIVAVEKRDSSRPSEVRHVDLAEDRIARDQLMVQSLDELLAPIGSQPLAVLS